MKQVILGIERLREIAPPWLREARIGLLVNQASVDAAQHPTKAIVAEAMKRSGKDIPVEDITITIDGRVA